jgi:hypothetical protein
MGRVLPERAGVPVDQRLLTVQEVADRFDVELRRRLQLGGLGVFNHDVTLAEFVEEWWQVHVIPNLAMSTRRSYRHTWAKHILPRLGGYKLWEITPRVVARYRADLLRDWGTRRWVGRWR